MLVAIVDSCKYKLFICCLYTLSESLNYSAKVSLGDSSYSPLYVIISYFFLIYNGRLKCRVYFTPYEKCNTHMECGICPTDVHFVLNFVNIVIIQIYFIPHRSSHKSEILRNNNSIKDISAFFFTFESFLWVRCICCVIDKIPSTAIYKISHF